MQDRYLFRGKRLDNGEWVYGNLIRSNDSEVGYEAIIIPTNDSNMYTKGGSIGDLGFENWHRVNESTICQCTGLKDKNGRVIWENDIASYSDLITRDKKTICIEWNKMQASFVRKYRSPMGLQYLYLDEYIASRMEVIGNTFDSPELLEG